MPLQVDGPLYNPVSGAHTVKTSADAMLGAYQAPGPMLSNYCELPDFSVAAQLSCFRVSIFQLRKIKAQRDRFTQLVSGGSGLPAQNLLNVLKPVITGCKVCPPKKMVCGHEKKKKKESEMTWLPGRKKVHWKDASERMGKVKQWLSYEPALSWQHLGAKPMTAEFSVLI